MKGKSEVLKVLQEMLEEELGAINQYFLHSEIVRKLGLRTAQQDTSRNSPSLR